nr:BAG family molecular chaperone regulator 2-like [Haemonchus contortus]
MLLLDARFTSGARSACRANSIENEACRRYLNACNPDQPDGPIDQRFQAQLIECTADDQKKIRRKLAQIISQFERAERTFTPQCRLLLS